MMQTMAFISQKGGSGKTTLAVHSAVAALECGERVVIIDTDRQRSATTWGNSRNLETPAIVSIAASRLREVVTAARHDAMTLALIDAAPHADPAAAAIAATADLVVIPVRPSAFDLAAAGSTVAIVRAAGTRAVFVLSACPFRAPEIVEARAALAAFGLPIAPTVITERRAFARAVASGRAVTEFETDGKAAEEIRALWAWLKKEMDHGSKTDRVGGIHQQAVAVA